MAADALSTGAVWLDLTRTLTRVGRAAPTGIDRVELAWADHLLAVNPEMRGLCRTTRGFLLLPQDGVRALIAAMRGGGTGLGQADALSRMTGRGDCPRHRAEAMLRHDAIDRCLPWGLSGMLRRNRAQTFINVGHTNQSDRVLGAMRRAGCEVVVLIHDLIPMTHPDLVPPSQPAQFADRIGKVNSHADLVVAVSEETEMALKDHWSGSHPPVRRADIGVSQRVAAQLPWKPARGQFLMVGTLEPRKNHKLILRAWDILDEELPDGQVPMLRILGQPGWRGDAISQEIMAHAQYGKTVFLETNARDADLTQAFAEADTLLYPTLAEGFGLPPHEALAHGILPICSDLPVLRFTLRSDAVYADANDVYSWVETIKKRNSGMLNGPAERSAIRPTWQDHFEQVAAALAELRG